MSTIRVPEASVEGWKCAVCNSELSYQSVSMVYMKGLFQIDLLGCSKCNLYLIPEKLAQGKMHQVEMLLEDK